MWDYNVYNANYSLLNVGKFNALPVLNLGLKHFITIWNNIAGSVSHTFVNNINQKESDLGDRG